ncbi:MAG: HAD-IIIA family hydrolase [Ignavibacteria bacterium]|nr:HAD-IIIA family hydrolase [Ignavibacteria bacterium]
MEKRKAIFFDRDGVVNYRIVGEYINLEENFRFTPDFLATFPKIKKLGYLVILVSNQKGVGKGLMTNEELIRIHQFMTKQLQQLTGELFDDVFYCTDVSPEKSWRLKPNPGMLLEAIEKWNIDPRSSWIVGDSEKDILAGKSAGVRTVLIGLPENSNIVADYCFPSLFEFLKILE